MIGVFVDAPNVYYNCKKKFDGRLNYEKLYQHISSSGEITRAFAYGYQAGLEAQPFIFFLKKIGFECHWMSLDSRYRSIDLRLPIALDVVRHKDHFSKLVLVTGDPQFQPLISWVKEQGMLTTVLGFRIPTALKECATSWHELPKEFVNNGDDKKSE